MPLRSVLVLRFIPDDTRVCGCYGDLEGGHHDRGVRPRPGQALVTEGAANSVSGFVEDAVAKHLVLREAARVLRPGDRFSAADIVAEPGMEEAGRDMESWTGCVAGALTVDQCRQALAVAG